MLVLKGISGGLSKEKNLANKSNPQGKNNLKRLSGQTRSGPDSDLKRVISGRNQVQIGFKSGPCGGVWRGSVPGAGGGGPAERGPVAPRKVSAKADN